MRFATRHTGSIITLFLSCALFLEAGQSSKPKEPKSSTGPAADQVATVQTVETAPVRETKSAPAAPPDEFAELQREITTLERWDKARLSRESLRPEAMLLETDRTPVDIVLRRTRALLAHLKSLSKAPDLAAEESALKALESQADLTAATPVKQQREIFEKITALRRQIAFRNPLLDFNRILFVKHARAKAGHMCDQYFGAEAVPGGGLYALQEPFGAKPVLTDLLASAVVENGRLKGKPLAGGAFLSPDLSYDGRSILFAYAECAKNAKKWSEASSYHVFKIQADGSHLVQLTDGTWNDFDPCWLPDGRIAFNSERGGGFGRCHGRPVPTYTVHAMNTDGSDIRQLSYHETNEWQPSVDNNGMLVYTRWDYVDRDSDGAHHIWTSFPDGRDPRSYHGNYPIQREMRPWMEMSIRAIPGSHRYIAVAAPHHGQDYGSLILIDQQLKDDHTTSQLKRITPEILFPEAEQAPGVPKERKGKAAPAKGTEKKSVPGFPAQVYGTPWPLSEDFYLAVYDPGQRNYGIYLVDSFGNRELIYRDPAIGCVDPIPFRSRPTPPVIPVATAAVKPGVESSGTVTVMNVYESETPWPAGVKIKELRVVNLFPKETPMADQPRVGRAAQSLCRGVLGTVPVEEDGSVYFKMPAGVPVYFQLLDENGVMVQTMRSDTYLHPGERMTCVGCHESKQASPARRENKMPQALQRPPSELKPDLSGSYPLAFPRLVQPVLDAKCAECHEQNAKSKGVMSLRADPVDKNGWSKAYIALQKLAWSRSGGNGAANRERQFSIPGQEGARSSQLYELLTKGHHDVKLTAEELHRFTLWMDCNSNFYGAYFNTEKQARGELVMPGLGLPLGVKPESLVH